MTEKTKTVYYCEYCKKHGLSRYFMERHEKLCVKNPENHRPCFRCSHLVKREAIHVNEFYDGSQSESEVDALYCTKLGRHLYTPLNEAKGNFYDVLYESVTEIELPNEPMPRVCEQYNPNKFASL